MSVLLYLAGQGYALYQAIIMKFRVTRLGTSVIYRFELYVFDVTDIIVAQALIKQQLRTMLCPALFST